MVVRSSTSLYAFPEVAIRSVGRFLSPPLQGIFNKEAMIQKLLAEYGPEEAAWIWWIDVDTVVANMALPLPLAKYEGYDLVAWGRREHVLEGRMNDGATPAARAEQLSCVRMVMNATF